MFVRAIAMVSWLGAALLAASGLIAWTAPADGSVSRPHIYLGTAAVLLLLFGQVWMGAFAWGSARALERAARTGAVTAEELAQARRRRRLGWPAAALTLVPAAVALLSGAELFAGRLPAWPHRAAAIAALLSQIAGLWLGGRALARHDRLLLDCDRRAKSEADC